MGALEKGQVCEESGGDDDSEVTALTADEEMEIEWPTVALEPDTFGLAICSLVRDFYMLARKKGTSMNRYSRVVTTFMLLGLCLTIQVWLLANITKFVSNKAVHDVRDAYDLFVRHMYGGQTYVLSEWPTLERRGNGGPLGPHFDVSAFATLDEEDQAAACRIPLSQPLFFSAVLYVWTLTCVTELRQCINMFVSLIVRTERCDTMAAALQEDSDEGENVWLIAQLTLGMKITLTGCVFIPRLCITLYLLWVGCRWLLATNNFSDLILNSVALEFILCLKDVTYNAIVPRRSMLDLEGTRIKPTVSKEPEGLGVFVGTVLWALGAALWVGLYMGVPGYNGWQQVLREYQWDVHAICEEWVASRYAV